MISNDFLYCEEVIKKNSQSFYKAFSQLPKDKRNAVYAIYTYCRLVDDLMDEYQDVDGLLVVKNQLENFFKGNIIDEPMWRALDVVRNTYDLDPQPFFELIDGQFKDYRFSNIKTQEELKEYSYLVAGTVGLMLLPILATKHYKELKDVAIQLGYAMQITNILRDVGEDLDRNRIYIPEDVLKEYGVIDLRQKEVNGSFIAAWEYEAHIAEELYENVFQHIQLFDQDSRFAVKLSANFYRGILNEVRRNNYDCFNHRAYVKKFTKWKLLIKSLF